MSDQSSQLKTKTARGLLWGGLGNGAMQLLNLFFGVFLARLLSSADYGVVGSLTFFSAIAGMLSESGFILALVNRREVSDRDYNSVFWFNLVVSVAIYATLFFCAPIIAGFYHQPEMTAVARFLFLSFMVGALSAVPTAYFFRNLMVRQRSLIQIISMVVAGIVGVFCAWQGMGYWGIAVQTVLYSALNALLLWVMCPWRPGLTFDTRCLREMLPFSLRQLATSLFTHLNNNIFSLLLGRFYGMSLTGFYTQGSKWTTMGTGTITGMINSVGQPVMRCTTDDLPRLRRVFGKLLRFTAFVSFPAMFGLAIIAEPLIVVAVTDKWLGAVPVMQVLCVGGAFLPFATLYSNLFNAINRPDLYMWNTIVLGCVQLGCLLVSYPFGLMTMLYLYTAVNIGWLVVWGFLASRNIGFPLLAALGAIAPYMFLAAATMGLTLWATGSEALTPLMQLFVRIIMAAAIYIGVLWLSGSVMLREALEFIRHKSPPVP
ncbi:MAG: lipopolysaccharide biosynthesis protein [Clostridiales bacterium]|nr:lipopolysaccharide biosynthesis protein [Clostridiales bacterium]